MTSQQRERGHDFHTHTKRRNMQHILHLPLLLPAAFMPTPIPRTALPRLQLGGPPRFVLMWFTPNPFVYETLYGGAEMCELGRYTARLATKQQALALGANMLKANADVTYSVYKLGDGDMKLLSSFPKGVNAEGARVKFRRRTPKTGGADDGTLLGVGGMGDDIWRELMERDAMGSIDEAWSRFRKELEMGRELEIVDENGDKIDPGGDYPDEDDAEID